LHDKSKFIPNDFPPLTKRYWTSIKDDGILVTPNSPPWYHNDFPKDFLVELSSTSNQHVGWGQVCIPLNIHKPPMPLAERALKK
jgi:hypothetical protein